MTAAGHALAVPGNHENKLVRALSGRQVQRTHGLAETLSQLEAESEEFRANAAHNRGLVAELRAKQEAARNLRPQRDFDRLERQNKLFVRRRIEMLLDPGTPFIELSTLAGYMFDVPDAGKSVPGGGLIAGIGFVAGIRCMVSANDSGIDAGALQPYGLDKTLRVQEMALENKLPYVQLVESAGANLLRYRVAPDNASIKAVATTLARVFEAPHGRFSGLVECGRDVSAAQLHDAYDAVVYAVGASDDRHLGIAGEDLPGSRSAREFVAWYCGHPDAAHQSLAGVHSAMTFGVGNVAVDVARVLSVASSHLAATDMPGPVLDELRASEVAAVWLVGRRGPQHARSTPVPLRELLELSGDIEVIGATPNHLDSLIAKLREAEVTVEPIEGGLRAARGDRRAKPTRASSACARRGSPGA